MGSGMGSESPPSRTRLRYRPGFAPARGSNRVPGGAAMKPSDYATLFELPDSVPITEIELRAIEVLLGSALREICAQGLEGK